MVAVRIGCFHRVSVGYGDDAVIGKGIDSVGLIRRIKSRIVVSGHGDVRNFPACPHVIDNLDVTQIHVAGVLDNDGVSQRRALGNDATFRNVLCNGQTRSILRVAVGQLKLRTVACGEGLSIGCSAAMRITSDGVVLLRRRVLTSGDASDFPGVHAIFIKCITDVIVITVLAVANRQRVSHSFIAIFNCDFKVIGQRRAVFQPTNRLSHSQRAGGGLGCTVILNYVVGFCIGCICFIRNVLRRSSRNGIAIAHATQIPAVELLSGGRCVRRQSETGGQAAVLPKAVGITVIGRSIVCFASTICPVCNIDVASAAEPFVLLFVYIILNRVLRTQVDLHVHIARAGSCIICHVVHSVAAGTAPHILR